MLDRECRKIIRQWEDHRSPEQSRPCRRMASVRRDRWGSIPTWLTTVLLCLLMGSLLLGCQSRGENSETSLPETTLTTTDPATLSSLPEEKWQFDSAFSAKRACTNALDLVHRLSDYDEEAVTAYRAFQNDTRNEMMREDITQGELEALYLQIQERSRTLTLKQGDVARVYITTDYDQYTVDRSYRSCRLGFVPAAGEAGEALSMTECQIRLRGNSTASGPKFPYAIKLSESESLFGMGKGKRWNLLANLHDKTMLRNTIGLRLADELDAPYTPKTKIVEVYFNGKYQGTYDLVEAITDKKTRVDIDVTAHECILEIDANRDDGSYYLVTPMGMRFKVDKPEDVSEEMRSWLDTFLVEAETALLEGHGADYFDLDSFVNVYLTLEVTKNLDSNSFSTRYFIKENKIYAGPVWDFDLSSGNVSPYVDEEGYKIYLNIEGRGDDSGDSTHGLWNRQGWFAALFTHEADFANMVAARYTEMRPLFENIYKDNELGRSWIGGWQDKYGTAFRRNYDEGGWDMYGRYSPYHMEPTLDYAENVQFLIDWFEDRLTWLDGVYYIG